MRCSRLLMIAMICLSPVATHAETSKSIGVMTTAATAPDREKTLELTVWYPAGAGGTTDLVGANGVFEGVSGRRDATIADGRFPVVLLAHGGLRAAPNLGNWIAAELAAHGFIVALVHAPPIENPRAAVSEVWLRPADLSTALSAIEKHPAVSAHIATNKIGAIGFLRGGTSVLGLAGARFDAARYGHSCDDVGSSPDCRWFERSGVDLHKADEKKIARSFLDGRIDVAIAVDPELSGSFTQASLAAIRIPVEIINLGRADAIAPHLDASDAARMIPYGHYDIVPDASSFSSFGLCTTQAPARLLAEGEADAVCRNGAGRSRKAIHAEIVSMIDMALRRAFAPANPVEDAAAPGARGAVRNDGK